MRKIIVNISNIVGLVTLVYIVVVWACLLGQGCPLAIEANDINRSLSLIPVMLGAFAVVVI